MHRWLLRSTLTVFAALMAVTPVLAAGEQAHGNKAIQPTSPNAALSQTLATSQPGTGLAGEGRPVLTARVPFETEWNSTVLSVNSKAMGLQVSRRNMASPVRMAITGAVIGAIVGAVAGDPLTDAAIGGIAGFGIGYIMHH